MICAIFICLHVARLTAHSIKSRELRASIFHPIACLKGELSVLTFRKIVQLSHRMATVSSLRLKKDGMHQNMAIEGTTPAKWRPLWCLGGLSRPFNIDLSPSPVRTRASSRRTTKGLYQVYILGSAKVSGRQNQRNHWECSKCLHLVKFWTTMPPFQFKKLR